MIEIIGNDKDYIVKKEDISSIQHYNDYESYVNVKNLGSIVINEQEYQKLKKLLDIQENKEINNYFADKLREMTNNYVMASDELFECKKNVKRALEILSQYRHYSTPTQEQNGENEDIVNNTIEILRSKECIMK